jgi:hypothetical protein
MTLRSIRSIGPLLMLAALTIPLSTTAQAEIPRQDGGVYVTISGQGLTAPEIRCGDVLQLPVEVKTIVLTYRPTIVEAARIQRVAWDGATPDIAAPGEYRAIATVGRPGEYVVSLDVRFASQGVPGGDRRRLPGGEVTSSLEAEVNPAAHHRTIVFNVQQLPAASVRAVIEYPGTDHTPPIDVNGDFRVDAQDLMAFWDTYGTKRGEVGYRALTDWNGSDGVGLEDLVPFVDAYQAWKGQDVGPTYGGGHAYPLTVKADRQRFGVPAPIYRARTEPPGYEAWIEWTVDRTRAGAGPTFTSPFSEAGEHQIRASVFNSPEGIQDARRLVMYRVAVPAFNTAIPLHDGMDYVFEARTDPPGYESYVAWFAATTYGTATPVHGRGSTFRVRFANTWGPKPTDPGDVFQLLSVQADNAYVTQVQKQPPSFSNMVWQNTGVSLDDNAAFHHSATLNGAITVAPDGSPSGTVTVAFDDGSTAVISQIPTGQTLISTGLITLDLRTPDGGGDSAVVYVTKGDSSAVSLSGLVESLRTAAANGTTPSAMSGPVRAMLALATLSKTSQWNQNVQVAMADNASELESVERFRINWCKVAVWSATAVVGAAAATVCIGCFAGNVYTVGAFTLSCTSICTGGFVGTVIVYGLLIGLWHP